MTDFAQGVRDFIYLPEYKAAFVACSEMNIVNRLDSYFTNYTMPWEKGNKKQKPLEEEAVVSVGSLQHFKIVTKDISKQKSGQINCWEYAPTWAKTYGSQTNILHWCDE